MNQFERRLREVGKACEARKEEVRREYREKKALLEQELNAALRGLNDECQLKKDAINVEYSEWVEARKTQEGGGRKRWCLFLAPFSL